MMSNKDWKYGVRPMHHHEVVIKRSVLLLTLIFYVWRWMSHLLPYQLNAAQMTKILYYPELHAYKFFGLDDVLIGHQMGSIIYSLLLVIIPMLLWFSPRHKFLSVAYVVSLLLYHTTQIAHMTHSVHFMVGMVVMSFIFMARSARTFDLVWEGLRYVVCMIYGSAFVWKILHGALWQWDFGEAVFKSNLATYYLQSPDTLTSRLYAVFLEHPWMLNVGTYVSFLLEGLFIVGFFTKKYDTFLWLGIFVLHHVLYLFVDTLFVEWYVFVLPFLTYSFWKKLNNHQKSPVDTI